VFCGSTGYATAYRERFENDTEAEDKFLLRESGILISNCNGGDGRTEKATKIFVRFSGSAGLY